MSGGAAQALEACLARGVREFVICAGARNIPLVLAAARCRGAKVWSHFEERGAAFFALGRVCDSSLPVAVVTTSGTAAAELLPALIEAHYQGRPLIVITGDRPEGYRGSGAPQAIEQVGLFGDYVEGCDDLRKSGESTLFGSWSGLRPWHINVCLEEDEEVPAVQVPENDFEPVRRRRPPVTALIQFLQEDFRGLVVFLGGLRTEEREEAFYFLEQLGAPVVADATSGLRESLGKLVLTDGDRLLRQQPPGKILRLGDVPTGRFWRDLESRQEIEVLSVTGTGFSGLARKSGVITGNVQDVLKGMGAAPAIGDVLDLLPASLGRRGLLEELLEGYPDSEPGMMRVLSAYAATSESVFLGNSQPIREWNLSAQMNVPVREVQASRGANGIDGQLSTWFGATMNQDRAWGIFGDLTVLYDLASPALLRQDEGRRRVLVVINNKGGRIFERLPRLRGLAEEERALMTNAHQQQFGSWAEMWGMDYQVVTGRESFEVESRDKPLVLELRPDDKQTTAFWENWEA